MRGNKVVAPGPEAASHKVRWKRKRQTLTVWINADGDIGVNSHASQDPIATKDWVRRECGLPAWTPKKRKPKSLPPLWERNQYLSESIKIARDRKAITFEQFALIINDLKNANPDDNLNRRAAAYAQEFGFTPAEIEAALRPQWRAYSAAERAAVFKITYQEYRRLGLRRSGCIEFDAEARRRLTKQRYNAKRRAERAAKRVSTSAECRAPLCPSEKVGTVRVPSSETVVGKHEPKIERKEITIEREEITRYLETPVEGDWCLEKDGSLQDHRPWRTTGEESGQQWRRTDRLARLSQSIRARRLRAATVKVHELQHHGGADNARAHASLRTAGGPDDRGGQQQRHHELGGAHSTGPP